MTWLTNSEVKEIYRQGLKINTSGLGEIAQLVKHFPCLWLARVQSLLSHMIPWALRGVIFQCRDRSTFKCDKKLNVFMNMKYLQSWPFWFYEPFHYNVMTDKNPQSLIGEIKLNLQSLSYVWRSKSSKSLSQCWFHYKLAQIFRCLPEVTKFIN